MSSQRHFLLFPLLIVLVVIASGCGKIEKVAPGSVPPARNEAEALDRAADALKAKESELKKGTKDLNKDFSNEAAFNFSQMNEDDNFPNLAIIGKKEQIKKCYQSEKSLSLTVDNGQEYLEITFLTDTKVSTHLVLKDRFVFFSLQPGNDFTQQSAWEEDQFSNGSPCTGQFAVADGIAKVSVKCERLFGARNGKKVRSGTLTGTASCLVKK